MAMIVETKHPHVITTLTKWCRPMSLSHEMLDDDYDTKDPGYDGVKAVALDEHGRTIGAVEPDLGMSDSVEKVVETLTHHHLRKMRPPLYR